MNVEEFVGEQMLKDEEKELVEKAYRFLDLFEEQCRPYHDEARDCRDIMRLRDPYQDEPGAKEKTIQLQTLKSTINNCVADQMQNIPQPKILPETPELEKPALDLQDALRYVIYDVNSFEGVHRRRVEDFFTTGTAVTQIVWDKNLTGGKGDIAIFRWPIEAFLWDPMAEDIQDSRALIKVSWHPVSWYRSHYPETGKYVQGDENSHNNVGVPSTQKNLTGADEDRAALLEFWYREYDAKKKRFTINVAYVAGHALLAHEKDVYIHGLYPFVIDVHSTVEGQPVGEGLVTELVPMQRYINRYMRYIDTNLRMSSKARMLIRKGSGINREDMANWETDIIEGDRVETGVDWAWLQHAPLNGMIVNEMLQLQNELKQDSGTNQFSRGETTGGVISGKAIVALQEAGSKIANMRIATLNNGFRDIIRQVIWLMAQFYTSDRMLLITGENGDRKEINMSARAFFGESYKKVKDGVMPPPYFVQVEVDRRNPARVDAQNEMYMQAYTMAAQAQQFFPLSALFRLMNVDGKDRLLPIIEANEQYQQQMMQLQQQIQQMDAQMQQMKKENDNLRIASMQSTNALANVNAQRPGFVGQPSGKVVEPGAGPQTSQGVLSAARQRIAQREASL